MEFPVTQEISSPLPIYWGAGIPARTPIGITKNEIRRKDKAGNEIKREELRGYVFLMRLPGK